MNKISNFIVKRRIPILIMFILFTIGSTLLINNVNINYDMTKYLPDSSGTKQGTELMNEEFKESTSINIMFSGLTDDEKNTIYEALGDIKGVDSVTYDLEDETYNKDGYTLYVVNIAGDCYTDEALGVLKHIEEKYADYEIYTGGDVVGNAENNESLSKVISLALVILAVILFIMSASWLEPILFLFTIALAVIINMGTNAVFASVSSTTNSIAAILQLVLSMDYSIMLIDRYRQEKEYEVDKETAMKKTISHGFLSIASSSVTTIVGLLCLLFMSFTIGKDMGLVLAKGVFISLLCILFVLPALTLLFDKQIEATKKKVPVFKMNLLGSFAYKCRYVILAVFCLLFVGSYFLQGNLEVEYIPSSFNSDEAKIEEVFPAENPIVVLYNNEDEEQISSLIAATETIDGVGSINAYGNTVGRKSTATELAESMDMDEAVMDILFYDYFKNGETSGITLADFINFMNSDVATNQMFSGYMDQATLEQLSQMEMLTDVNTITTPLPAAQLGAVVGMDEGTVSNMIKLYYGMSGTVNTGTMSLEEFINFLADVILTNETYAVAFDQARSSQLKTLQVIVNGVMEEKEFTSEELISVLGIDAETMNENTMDLLYLFYFSQKDGDPSREIPLYDFMNFLKKDVLEDERFADYFTDGVGNELLDAFEQLEDGKASLSGEKYSRIIIDTSFGVESKGVYAFIEDLETKLSNDCEEYYIVGNSPLAYEMQQTFKAEFQKISIITGIAIFVVVIVTFHSSIISLILVMLILSSVYITMGITSMQGQGMNYLALIIVQALLMGATIDYGILYTSYYRERRIAYGESKKEATKSAYRGSIMTIMTSGSILVLVTLVVGTVMSDPTTSQVCLAISKGSFVAILMVILILPGVLTAMDRAICKKCYKKEEKQQIT